MHNIVYMNSAAHSRRQLPQFVCVMSLADVDFVQRGDGVEARCASGEVLGSSTGGGPLRRRAVDALNDALASPGVLRPVPDHGLMLVPLALLNPFTGKVGVGPTGSTTVLSTSADLDIPADGLVVDLSNPSCVLVRVERTRAELLADLTRLSSV